MKREEKRRKKRRKNEEKLAKICIHLCLWGQTRARSGRFSAGQVAGEQMQMASSKQQAATG